MSMIHAAWPSGQKMCLKDQCGDGTWGQVYRMVSRGELGNIVEHQVPRVGWNFWRRSAQARQVWFVCLTVKLNQSSCGSSKTAVC